MNHRQMSEQSLVQNPYGLDQALLNNIHKGSDSVLSNAGTPLFTSIRANLTKKVSTPTM